MKRKTVTLAAIRPNRGVHAEYHAELNNLLRSVRNDVLALVKAGWEEPDVAEVKPIALDAAGNWLTRAIDALIPKWMKSLDDLADVMASKFVRSSARHYDNNLKRQLRKHGFTARLQMTEYTEQALRASIGENVGLIRSIPTEYLGDVSKYVWEAVSGGFDLGTLTDNLQHAYHISRNRAALIAVDQSNKATAVIEQARREELDIDEAIWQHSSAAKVPRKSHVAAHGKTFKVSKGMLIDGEYILPGMKIRCGCTSKSVIRF